MKALNRLDVLGRLWLILVLIAIFAVGCTGVAVQTAPEGKGICSIAWMEDDEIKVAVASNTEEVKELTIGVGGYILGPKILDSKDIRVEKGGMVICEFEKKEEAHPRGQKIKTDTVFIYKDREMKELLDTIYIQGYHPAQNHYSLSKYLVEGGDTVQFSLFSPEDINSYEKVIWVIGKSCLSTSDRLEGTGEITLRSDQVKEIKHLDSSLVDASYLPGEYGEKLLNEMKTSHVIEFIESAKIDFELSIPEATEFSILTVSIMTYSLKEGDEIVCGGLGGPQMLVCPKTVSSE